MATPNRRRLDLTPSSRPHGAQRMFAATTLTLEAVVVLFALLVAHQLVPQDRVLTWTWGLITAVGLAACAGLLRRGTWPYLLGVLLQVPVVLLGLQVGLMWVVGGFFALLYVSGLFAGHRYDAEKDAVDARVRAEHGGAAGSDPDPR